MLDPDSGTSVGLVMVGISVTLILAAAVVSLLDRRGR